MPPSGLVTVTFRTPAEPPTLMVRLIDVAVRVTNNTVMPEPPEKVTWLAATNPVPLIVTVFSSPLESVAGVALVGFGEAFTIKQLAQIASKVPARLTTTLLRATVASAATSITAESLVELTNAADLRVTPAPLNATVDAAVKPLPLMVTALPATP